MKLKKLKLFPVLVVSLFLPGLQIFAQPVDHWEHLIQASDTWKYIIPASEPMNTWTDPEFDDSAWLSGPGGIGYGDNDDNTVIPDGTMSVFMRKSFDVDDVSKFIAAVLYVDYDDGFVAYLNGIEIARANIGTIGIRPAYNATASTAIEPAAASGNVAPRFAVSRENLSIALRSGKNILSVQVHNYNLSSSDFSSTINFFAAFSSTSENYRFPPAWFVPTAFSSSNLPIILINTWGAYIPGGSKIDANMMVINNGPGIINTTLDKPTDFSGLIGIEVRGQSSQMFPKKQYSIETRNYLKADSVVKLLGLPKESDWVLGAPYSDKSLMRNPISFYLGNKMSYWHPHTKWFELYLNDDYQGIYYLVEKIKRDKKRVDVPKMLPTDIAGDELTGGYIVKVDKLDGLTANDYFYTNPVSYYNARHYAFSYVYPKAEDIVAEQKTYIKDFLTRAESALNGTSFKDPVIGYRAYFDELSFAEFEIIEELANDVDGYRYSTYFHKKRDSEGGKLYAGPLWDFDLCYGNVDYSAPRLASNQWLYVNYGTNEGSPMHWWRRLMEDPNYAAIVKWRYSHLRAGALSTDSIMIWLNQNEALLGDAIGRNFTRWPILDQYIWPNAYIGNTYDNEMDYLKTWLTNRLTWMDSKWLIPLGSVPIETSSVKFEVYPNPFSNRFMLSLTPKYSDDVDIKIFNVQGQQVFTSSQKVERLSSNELAVENINLESGVYILQLVQRDEILGTERLICTGNR